MRFERPEVMLLLPAVVAGLIWAARAQRRHAIQAFAALSRGAAQLGGWTARAGGPGLWLPFVLLGLALTTGLVALSRPSWGERPVELTRDGRDLMVVLDLSRSMKVEDVSPNRLAVAKRAVRLGVASLDGDRVGLIVFGGSAFVQLPLTANRATFDDYLAAATPDDLADPATDLERALNAAATLFEHTGTRGYQAILLVTDGETEGDLRAVTERLRGARLPVYAVGVGSTSGAPVPADTVVGEERWHRDYIGRVVTSRLEEEALREVAAGTGGSYHRWTGDATAAAIARELDGLPTRPLPEGTTTEPVERFQWPLALMAALLFVELYRTSGWRPRRRSVAALGSVAVLLACAGGVRRAERLYEAGDYRQALALFDAAAGRDSTAALAYNGANALYRLKRYDEAAKRYRSAAGSAAGFEIYRRFNLGNTLVRASEEADDKVTPLLEAVEAYEAVLVLDPADLDAKWNLELTLRRLNDLGVAPGSRGRAGRADFGRGSQNTPGYEGTEEAAVGAMAGGGYGEAEGESVEELTEEDARALLESVAREQLSTHEGQRAGRARSEGRDW